MRKALGKWLKIQPEEMSVFAWAALIYFMVRAAQILFNNYGETTFLKRFGVEYLPMVYMANAIVTFVVMGAMTGLLKRTGSARLLSMMLIFCGLSVAALRLVVVTDITAVYPVIFLLKAQYEALLVMVFWNLANDLFNTRQSKRIFPLITAGGVVGGMVGSFGTPALVKLISLDNLLLIYMVLALGCSLLVRRMDALFPVLDLPERAARKTKKRSSIVAELKQVWPLVKESTLIKILVLITLIPNLMIPIMNYMFNYAVDSAFKTEGGMIQFFGYFRGVLNFISLFILLFVGRIYTKWGLPVALMFHPANYIIAFLSFLLRFNIFSAMYARITTNVLRETINNPARNILIGLLPSDTRPLLRPFLRGTVVRIGILVGSGIIMASEDLYHPRYLAIWGASFGLCWLASSVWLKRAYSSILLGLISANVLDLRSLEPSEVAQIFRDRKAQTQMVQACQESDGSACVWYAEMMRTQRVEGFERHIVELLQQKDERTTIDLLPLVPAEAGAEAVRAYSELYDPQKPNLARALAEAAARLDPQVSDTLLQRIYHESPEVPVKALAAGGLYRLSPDEYRPVIEGWLASDNREERLGGALAAGQSGDHAFLPALRGLLGEGQKPEVLRQALIALNLLDDPALNPVILNLMRSQPELLPRQVLADYVISNDDDLTAFIGLLGSEDEELAELALDKLHQSEYQNPQLLIESLTIPKRRLRRGVFTLMESLKISDRDIIAFAKGQLARAYGNLMEAKGLEGLEASPARDLLIDHMGDKKDVRLETILRVLSTQDDSDQMRIVWRGLGSPDDRLRSNAVEALEALVGRALSEAMIPLLEHYNLTETLAAGKKLFDMGPQPKGREAVLGSLLAKTDWVTLYLAMAAIEAGGDAGTYAARLAELAENEHPRVAAMARRLSGRAPAKEGVMAEEKTSLSEKILMLRRMEIFDGLEVAELAAVASVCREMDAAPGDKIITEGEVGDTMYLILEGKVAVSKGADDGCDVELDDMGPGAYFGEMALFDDSKRSATVVAKEPTRLLWLDKREFAETVREYPQVALQICKELSRRVRHLHHKIQAMPVCF